MKDPKRYMIYYAQEEWYLTDNKYPDISDIFITSMSCEGDEEIPTFYGSEGLEVVEKFLVWYHS